MRTPHFVRVALTLGAALLLPACHALAPTEPADSPARIQLASDGALRFDPAAIESATVTGDLLQLQVRHGGGCERHDFALHHTGEFMESSPVQTTARLSHDAHGDRCRALVSAALRFDLGPLKEKYREVYRTDRGALILRIVAPGETNTVTSVRYEF